MESLSRQLDLERLLYQSTASTVAKGVGLEAGGPPAAQATAATVLTPEKAEAASSSEEVQIKLVDKLQNPTKAVEASTIATGVGGGSAAPEHLDATSQLVGGEAGAGGALDIAQRRALLLGRTKQRHVCLQCGRECPSKHKLKRHLSTHSEQRPYNCHLCGKSFKWTEYLAKHMRTQHPGVEVPAFSAHGTGGAPGSQSCLSPPSANSTSSSSLSPTAPAPISSTLSQQQQQLSPLSGHQKPSDPVVLATNSSISEISNSDSKEGIGIGLASLGSTAIGNTSVVCDDSVYETSSHLMSSLPGSLPPHSSLLSKNTFPETPPITDDILQTTSQQQTPQQHTTPQSMQQQQHQSLQPSNSTQSVLNNSTSLDNQQLQAQQLLPQSQPVASHSPLVQHGVLQQLQQQQQQHLRQQEQNEKQKLLQQQIQRHQLQQQQQQQLQQQQQTAAMVAQPLMAQKQQQQPGMQTPTQILQQQPAQQQTQQSQDFLQQTPTELNQFLQGQGQVLADQQQQQQQQMQFTSPSPTVVASPHSQPNVVPSTTQMNIGGGGGGGTTQIGIGGGAVGGGGLQAPHPLATHVMTSEATVVHGMGSYNMDQTTNSSYTTLVSSSGLVCTTGQDTSSSSSSNSQVFTSPVYNSQSSSQVYQMPAQPQSTHPQQVSFTDSFSSSTAPSDSVNYNTGTSLTGLSLPHHQHHNSGQQSQQTGGMDGPTSSFSLTQTQQPQQQTVMANQQGFGGGTGGGGGGGIASMNQMGSQATQDPNLLHMQAQIAQSAYELQSVQMEPSMQSYDGSGMVQPSSNFHDGSSGGYHEVTNTYQEGTTAYQTGSDTCQIQDGVGGYQEGVAYHDHQQPPQGQPGSSTSTNTTSFNNLEMGASRQVYSSPVLAQNHGLQPQDQQSMAYNNTGVPADVATSAEVVSYGQQMSMSDGVYSSLGTNIFQQAPLPVSTNETASSSLQLQTTPVDKSQQILLGGVQQQQQQHQQTPEILNPVEQVENIVALSQEAPSTNDPVHSATEIGGPTEKPANSNKPQVPKESVGIQCEVGPETFRALKEEEAQAKLITSSARIITTPQDLFEPSSSIPSQKQTNSSSLALTNAGSPPVHDSFNAHSPGRDTMSGGEGSTSVTGQVDKIVRKFPCELSSCGKAYVHRKDLIRHMTLRHGISPQKLEAVVIETPEKPYTCQVGTCRKSYFHQKDLRRHQRQCHAVGDNGSLSGAVELTDADGKVMIRFPCDFPGCQRSYVHKKDLVRHKRVYHKDDSKKPSIPVPVKFTEADLKRIRHDEKSTQEKEAPLKKPRLDSTGSLMSSGEDQSQISDGGPAAVAAQIVSETVGGIAAADPSLIHGGGGGGVSGLNQIQTGGGSSGGGGGGGGGDVGGLESAELRTLSEEEKSQLNSVQLALGLSQEQSAQLGMSSQQSLQQSPTNQLGMSAHHLPNILRRPKPGGGGGGSSNDQQQTASLQNVQDQQLTNELALRNLASLMLGGLQGVTTNSSGSGSTVVDSAHETPPAFSASSLSPTGDAPTGQPAPSTGDPQQATAVAAAAQFDPAAILSALTSVMNNPDVLTSATSPPLEQQQMVAMESVATALQYLTSTSNT